MMQIKSKKKKIIEKELDLILLVSSRKKKMNRRSLKDKSNLKRREVIQISTRKGKNRKNNMKMLTAKESKKNKKKMRRKETKKGETSERSSRKLIKTQSKQNKRGWTRLKNLLKKKETEIKKEWRTMKISKKRMKRINRRKQTKRWTPNLLLMTRKLMTVSTFQKRNKSKKISTKSIWNTNIEKKCKKSKRKKPKLSKMVMLK